MLPALLCRVAYRDILNKKISFNPFPGQAKVGYGSIFENLLGFFTVIHSVHYLINYLIVTN